MTSRTVVAVAGSVAVHALLAAGLILYLSHAPEPETLASLDLSSVELSFAETEDEAAAVAPMPPVAAEAEPVRPKTEEPPSEPRMEKPLPPDPIAPRFPEVRERTPFLEPARNPVSERPEPARVAEERPQPAAAPRQAKVDAPPRPRRAIRPDYPKGARQRGEQGEVVLEIRVSESGTVSEAKVAVSSGFAELDEAAARAARAAKFAPAKFRGEAVASTARLKLAFRLK